MSEIKMTEVHVGMQTSKYTTPWGHVVTFPAKYETLEQYVGALEACSGFLELCEHNVPRTLTEEIEELSTIILQDKQYYDTVNQLTIEQVVDILADKLQTSEDVSYYSPHLNKLRHLLAACK